MSILQGTESNAGCADPTEIQNVRIRSTTLPSQSLTAGTKKYIFLFKEKCNIYLYLLLLLLLYIYHY